jgi:hypothetical protein
MGFCTAKEALRRVKRKPTKLEKYFQVLIRQDANV